VVLFFGDGGVGGGVRGRVNSSGSSVSWRLEEVDELGDIADLAVRLRGV
jgi:hypothetical protein